jgi:hypothetical protein
MSAPFFILIVVSELISLWFLRGLLKSSRSRLEKFALALVLMVPVLGPFVYAFLSEDVPTNHPLLRDNGPRGNFTHSMIGIKADLARAKQEEAIRAEKDGDPSRSD